MSQTVVPALGSRIYVGPPKGPHYTPFLVVRYAAGDDGTRPLPDADVFWESPDVWTESSAGRNQPKVGEPAQVFAQVSNFGLQDAAAVTVRFWWADPSLAITEQSAHLIGVAGTTVLSHSSTVVKCPTDWAPILANGGHECLIAEAYIPTFDPLTDPMQPLADRHVGQKNESLILLQQGQAFSFTLSAFNFTTIQQQVVVEARRSVIPRDFEQRFATKAGWSTRLIDPARPLPLSIRIDKAVHRLAPVHPSGTPRVFEAAAQAPIRADHNCLGPVLATQTHTFEPKAVHRLTLDGAMPATALPGEIHVFRVTQRIGQVITGGYSLYLMRAR